jgi:hypothetical protein
MLNFWMQKLGEHKVTTGLLRVSYKGHVVLLNSDLCEAAMYWAQNGETRNTYKTLVGCLLENIYFEIKYVMEA